MPTSRLKRTRRMPAATLKRSKKCEVHFRLRADEQVRFGLAVERSHSDSLSSLCRRLLHEHADRLGIPR